MYKVSLPGSALGDGDKESQVKHLEEWVAQDECCQAGAAIIIIT